MILSYIRTILLYLVLIFCIRLMGKRQVGQMEPSEFVVTMMVANLAVIPMENEGVPLYVGLIPMLTILGMELVLSGATLRSIRLRKLLCGKPVILIENGRILQENLREKDVLDIRAVQYAILETNGNLSVFPFPSEQPASAKEAGIYPKDRFLPVTVISDGHLLRENLRYAAKDEAWVHQILGQYRASIAGTWLLSVDKADHVVWLGKE